MTSQPQVPGAAAVYLYREQTTDDFMHVQSFYIRLKVLTEAGKEYANIQLPLVTDIANVTDVAGRTIHSDGTVVIFTGKPYERVVEKTADVRVREKVFTLPDVEVGSILECRFKIRIDDGYVTSPEWFIQQNLFVRKGYFFWKATDDEVLNGLTDAISQGIAWSSVLPPGAAVKSTEVPALGNSHAYHRFELNVERRAAGAEGRVHAADPQLYVSGGFLPCVRAVAGRVLEDRRQGVGEVQREVHRLAGQPGGCGEYAGGCGRFGHGEAAEDLREHHDDGQHDLFAAARGERGQGAWPARGEDSAGHMAAQERRGRPACRSLCRACAGGGDEGLCDARDGGHEHVLAGVADAGQQLEDDIAIVVLDGKEQFFDPGQRDCPFGQMAWKHTATSGLREMDGGATAVANTPSPSYLQSQTQRIADLTMDADGTAHGTIKITWMGSPALAWRQQALRRDEQAVKRSMREWVEKRIPAGMKPEITTVQNLDDYEKPLIANFNVETRLATLTAKRLILPGQFFEVNSKPLFPQPTRDIAVYFEHGARISDAMRVKFPADMQIESVPKEDTFTLQSLASYHSRSEAQATQVLMRRTYDLGTVFFLPKEYTDVKSFYDKVAVDDQKPVVLLNASAATAPATPAAAAKAGDDKSD